MAPPPALQFPGLIEIASIPTFPRKPIMKRMILLGMGLLLPLTLQGCGGTEGSGGNPDAAAVIGAAPDDQAYGVASSDLMNKMHGDSLAKKGATKKATEPSKDAPAK